MSSTVVGVSPDNSVRQAARIMLDHRVSGLPVVDGDGRLLGVISEGDLIRRTELGGTLIAPPGEAAEPAKDRANALALRLDSKQLLEPNPT